MCFISAIKEPAQSLQAGFWASIVLYHNFELLPFPASPSPPPPPMKTSLILPCTSNHLFFYKLFGGNFCEQPLVLGKLLNTMKWSTFWVSFIRVLTALGWLQCIEIFKIDYLVTSKVRFGTVSVNQVTNWLHSVLCATLCMHILPHMRPIRVWGKINF